MGCCGFKLCISFLFPFSAILLTISIVFLLMWSSVYDSMLVKELTITNGSKGFDMWKETPIPMYLTLYLFNWTNADEVIKSKWKVKPEMRECGPYVFTEKHFRVNITFNANDTVTYLQKRVWHFVPDQSNGSLDDKITTVNPIIATVGHFVREKPILLKILVNGILMGYEKELSITKTAREFLFDGYEDELLKVISSGKIPGFSIPFDKFGWFYNRNNSATYDGSFNMYSGVKDLELLGIIDQWNGQSRTDFYRSYCGIVNGTSGELWPPVKDYNRVSIFSPDICSPLALDYEDTQSILGVTGKRYIAGDYFVDNGTKYPQQECFLPENEKLLSGVRDVSKCKFNAPAFVSYPHFYLADPSYLSKVQGMSPNKIKHQTHIVLEPNTGIPLDVRAQLQINIFVQSISGMSLFKNIPETYLPVLWFNQSATLTEEYASMVKVLLVLPDVGTYTGWGVLSFALLLAALGVYAVFHHNRQQAEKQYLLTNSPN